MIRVKCHLVKSLSTSYSYFIHVSRYTKNSKKAKSAMAMKANTDTEEEIICVRIDFFIRYHSCTIREETERKMLSIIYR